MHGAVCYSSGTSRVGSSRTGKCRERQEEKNGTVGFCWQGTSSSALAEQVGGWNT